MHSIASRLRNTSAGGPAARAVAGGIQGVGARPGHKSRYVRRCQEQVNTKLIFFFFQIQVRFSSTILYRTLSTTILTFIFHNSTMHDNDPEVRKTPLDVSPTESHAYLLNIWQVLEREKRRTLSGEQHKTPHIDGAPGWNEHLASSAEAHVKVRTDQSTRFVDSSAKYYHIRPTDMQMPRPYPLSSAKQSIMCRPGIPLTIVLQRGSLVI